MKKRRTELDLFWRRAGNALSCGERLGQSRDAIGILQRRTLRATAVKQSEWNKSQSARKKELWLYYALMATIGSVIGGYVTYRLARKGGKETVERKFSGRTLDKVYRIFGRWGFGAIAIAALLPPPVPMVPFVFAAGAMQYSVGKFLVALTAGRIVRYSLLAFLAAHYGRQMLTTVMSQLKHPVLIAVMRLTPPVIAPLLFMRAKKHSKRAHTHADFYG